MSVQLVEVVGYNSGHSVPNRRIIIATLAAKDPKSDSEQKNNYSPNWKVDIFFWKHRFPVTPYQFVSNRAVIQMNLFLSKKSKMFLHLTNIQNKARFLNLSLVLENCTKNSQFLCISSSLYSINAPSTYMLRVDLFSLILESEYPKVADFRHVKTGFRVTTRIVSML